LGSKFTSRNWAQLRNFLVVIARVELASVHFLSVCIHNKRGHDFLLLCTASCYVEVDLFGLSVKLDVQLVDFDV